MKLKKHAVQNLSSAIAHAKLIEFEGDSSKLRGKKTHDDSDGDGDQDKSLKCYKPFTFRGKGKGKKDEALRKYSCFLCNGPH